MRRTLTAAAAALVFTLTSIPALAQQQGVGDYLELVRVYTAGDGAHAIAQLARWKEDDVKNAVRAVAATSSPGTLIAAAMLETDLANTILDVSVPRSRFAVTMAEALLLAGHRESNTRVHEFARRWAEFVPSMFASAGCLQDAAWYVHDGLLAYPKDSMLYVVRGTIVEARLRATSLRDLRGPLPENPRQRETFERVLKAATSAYQLAADADDRNAVAWLHLGWIDFFLEDKRAKARFEGALARASDDTVRYLAHLFLGGVAERQSLSDEALREYEAARLAGARFQTPYVAISRAEESAGHEERAQAVAMQAAQMRKDDDDDPWWDFRIAFDRPALMWLRAEARRP